MLYELLYTSCASRPMQKVDLVALLEQSREKNARLGVTGILVYHKRQFMQILEGDKEVVLELFDTIKKDNRHQSVRIFYEGQIYGRAFGTWSMAFGNLDDMETRAMPGWSSFLDDGFSSEAIASDPSIAQQLLLSLRETLLSA